MTFRVMIGWLVAVALVADPEARAVELPELPAVLADIVPSRRGHHEKHGAKLAIKEGRLGIQITSEKPLSTEQWDAIAALGPRWLTFNDKSLSNADMERLVAINPEEIHLRITPLTGIGAQRFGEMKRLTRLFTHHLKHATPEARDALANHPTLEEFRTAGAFCIEALEAPGLRSVEFAEKALTVANIETHARRSTITSLSLFAHNMTAVDGEFLEEVAKIQSLESLRIAFTALAFEGGLAHLQRLPRLEKLDLYLVDVSADDLRKLEQGLPNLKIRHQPMPAEYRDTWDAMIAKEAKAAVP